MQYVPPPVTVKAVGVGLTSTVAVNVVPGQVFAVGVIVNVTVIGPFVVLVSAPEILPEPFAAMPVTLAVLSRVQVKVVLATGPASAIVVIVPPEQIVWEAGVAVPVGVGLTITVAVIALPGQVFAVGVIVNVTVIGALVVLVSVPEILPEPLAAIPVTPGLLRVQLNVVFATLPVRTIVVIVPPEQIVCEDGVATAFGVGFTVMVNVCGVPWQVVSVGPSE